MYCVESASVQGVHTHACLLVQFVSRGRLAEGCRGLVTRSAPHLP